MPKLIAGEAEYNEALWGKFAIKRLQSLVLWRETAFARDIYDEQGFALVNIQRGACSIQSSRRKVVDTCHLLFPN
jgi:hypothetical protein